MNRSILMKRRQFKAVAFLLGGALLAFSTSALATNGYFTHGVGAKSKGMAGTGIGSNANMGPIMVASNPALGVFAPDQWELGLGIFSPRRSYSVTASNFNGQFGAFSLGAGSYDSSSNYFPIPYLAKNWKLDDERALTLVFFGRGGMNTNWDDPNQTASFDPDGPGPGGAMAFPGTFGAGNAGVDLMQAFLALNYAGMASYNFSSGIAPVIAMQSFEATGVGSFAPFTKTFAASGGQTQPTSLTNNSRDFSYGWGIAVGLWWGITENFGSGLSYQSTMSMGELDKYSDLFAEAGGFDIPASAKLGFSWKTSDAIRLNFDIEYTRYSEVASVGNPLRNIFSCPTTGQGGTDVESCLGGGNGAGFGWEDMTTYKVGLEWMSSQDYTWRFGYSYGSQPIQSADVLFNILAPGVMEQHLTVGLTGHRSDGGGWTLSFMYAPENTVTGPNVFDGPPGMTQTIELKMSQFEIEFAWAF
jgi:long-chain fatty acid transport protein